MAPEPRAAPAVNQRPQESHESTNGYTRNEKLATMLTECAFHVKMDHRDHPLLQHTLYELQTYVHGPKPDESASSASATRTNVAHARGHPGPETEPSHGHDHGKKTWLAGHHAEQEWCEQHFTMGCACKLKNRTTTPVATTRSPHHPSSASVASTSSSVDHVAASPSSSLKPAFQRPVNNASTLIANGWIEQQRRSRMRVVWKEVLASLVEGRKPGEESTLWIQREVVNSKGKKELEALHQIPVKWIRNISYAEYSTDNRFTIRVYNVPDEFIFRTPRHEEAAQNWVSTLRSMQEIVQRKAKVPVTTGVDDWDKTANASPRVPHPVSETRKSIEAEVRVHPYPNQSAGDTTVAAQSTPHRLPIKELRALAHGAGVNTHGMERGELERVVKQITARAPPASSATSSRRGQAYDKVPHEQEQLQRRRAEEQETTERRPAEEETSKHTTAEEEDSKRDSPVEVEKHNVAEEMATKRRLADDEAAKQSATEQAAADKRSAAEVELAKRRVLEERRQAAEEELAKRQLAEKETEKRHRLAEDEARKHKEGEEEIRRRNADRVKSQQDAERRRREEEERRVLEKERMQRDEEELRRKAAERQAADQRKQQEEAVRKQQEAWAQQQQSWQRQQAEEEQRRRDAEQQAAEARRRQEEAYRRQQQWQQQQQRPPGSQQYQQQHGIPQHHPPPPPSNQQYYHRSTPPPTSQPSHPQTSGHPGPQPQQQTKSPVNMKYAKMANQTGDSSQMAITNIKHGVLVEWALQPPTLQVLRPIDILLTTIHTVFPPKFGCPGHGYFAKWTSIKLEDVRKGSQPDDDKLTKGIRKLRFFLHPDKLPRDLTAEQAFMCKMLWDITSDAFEEHKKWSEKLV
jgi:hypothetical protein